MTTSRHFENAGSLRPLFIKSVGSFVPKLARKAFEKYGFSTVALLTDWPAIAGSDLAEFTLPERLKWPRKVAISGDPEAGEKGRPGATLMLRVEPARALEIQYGTDQLIERINGYFGYRAVAAIRILQAPVVPPAPTSVCGVSPKVSSVRPCGKSSDHNCVAPQARRAARGADQPVDARLRTALKRLEATFSSTP